MERVDPCQIIKSVKAEPHTAPYKIHKYFARRPWNVFEQMISAVSLEGEIVMDPFCGGGVTIYEAVKTNRKAIGLDVNPLAIFIVKNMLKRAMDHGQLLNAIEECKRFLSDLYDGYNSFVYQNRKYEISWLELTYEVECNYCGWHNLLLNENKISNGVYKCQNPECKSNHSDEEGIQTKSVRRLGYVYCYLINKPGRNKIIKKFDHDDYSNINKHISFLHQEIEKRSISLTQNKIPILWDRQFEDQLEQKGILFFEDFFTTRNLLMNTLLKWKIDSFKSSLCHSDYELLRLIHSNVLKETNIMSFTNDTWQGGNPTTWSKHAFWVPSQFCEVSLLNSFDSSAQRILHALEFNKNYLSPNLKVITKINAETDSDVILLNGPIYKFTIPSESVDAIVTDPPYGSNVQYLELSHFWYHWNKDLYESESFFEDEAIANRKKFKGAKSMKDYESLLYSVFKESFRVLKPERYMTLTFNNKNITAWLGLLIAIFRAGFSFVRNGIIFQDGVENYRQTAHTKFEGSPFGDFIYVFIKSHGSESIKIFETEAEFIEKIDGIFKYHISTNGAQDKNSIKRSMFLEAMPSIENYSKLNLNENPDHGLYNFFTKTYFKNLYD